MSLKLINTYSRFVRTASLPTSTSFTQASWVKFFGSPPVSGTNTTQNGLFGMDASGAASILYARRYNNSDTTYDAGIIKTGFNQSNFSPQPPELTWFYLALSCSGTGASDSKLRWWSVSGVLQNSVTVAGQSYTPATLYFGDPHGAIAYAKYAYCRVWDAVLTDAELLNEMRSAAIVKTASINTALRTNSLTDVSGNGRDWTDVNADVVIDTEDNPPMWVFKKVAAARRHVPHLIR